MTKKLYTQTPEESNRCVITVILYKKLTYTRNVWSRSRQFGTSAEVSGHFGTSLMVPKCLGSEVSWVRSVLTPVHCCLMPKCLPWCRISSAIVLICPDSSALLPKCPYTSALVPKCLGYEDSPYTSMQSAMVTGKCTNLQTYVVQNCLLDSLSKIIGRLAITAYNNTTAM